MGTAGITGLSLGGMTMGLRLAATGRGAIVITCMINARM
jgi:hypothetical protein